MRNFIRNITSLSPKKQDQRLPEDIERKRSASHNAFPLSFAQQRLWDLDQMIPGTSVYHLPLVIRFTGNLDRERLEQSLQALGARHAILRTVFRVEKAQPVQMIAPTAEIILSLEDMQGRSSAEQEEQLRSLAAQEMRRPFDLAEGPPLRALLLRLSIDEHVLIVIIHRILCDDASAKIFLHDLAAFYHSLSASEVPPLPTLPRQYAEFAAQQREWGQTEEAHEHLAYWKQRLADIPSVLQLPADRPRPATQSFRAAHISFQLSTELTEKLRKLAQQENTPLSTLLLTALGILLFRSTRQEDIVIGIPVSGRTPGDSQGLLIGPFANTLPLRLSFAGNPRFVEMLKETQQTLRDARTHEVVPVEILIEALQPTGDLSYNALFQITFAFIDTPAEPVQTVGCAPTADLSMTRLPITNETTSVDLAWTLRENPAGLTGHLAYSTDLFDAAALTRLIEHFQILLAGIVAHPEQQLQTLPLLSESQRHQLLVTWNTTDTAYPMNMGVHQLFEAQVERTPLALAVVDEYQEVLTYARLNEQANRLARHLCTLGVGPDVPVGISLERSVQLPVCLLAVLKAGGAYVPLDPDFPAERLSSMIEDAHIRVFLTQEQVLARLRLSLPANVSPVCIDSGDLALARYDGSNLHLPVDPAQLAYILYTSGSTGKPKGVQIPQRALVNLLCSMAREPGLSAGETLLAVTTLSFDIAELEIYLPLLVGGRIAIASRDTATNGRALAQALEQFNVTMLQATPVSWRMLVQSGWAGKADLVAITGGEALTRDLAERLLPRVRALYNAYGPTETTIYSTCQHIQSLAEPISIGRPLANTRVYILDTHLQPVPIGVPGELFIGGAGLARGYLGRPDLTAERFVPDPFADSTPASMYGTGDLARYLPDGRIEHLGRLDHQVKIRGFRIELGEIEATLSQSPAVQACIVLAQDDPQGNKRLVAFVINRAGFQLTMNEVHQFLKRHLPDYMLPSALVPLQAFPLTPSGKIDRQALSQLESTGSPGERSLTPPRTPTEKRLVEIAAPLLNLEQVGIDENFFLIGGNSFMGIQFIAQVADIFGITFPLRVLFENPTVQQFASQIEQSIFTRLATMDENEASSLLKQASGTL